MIPMLPSGNAATRTFCHGPLEHLAPSGVAGRVLAPSSDRAYRLLNRPDSRVRVLLAAVYWYGLVVPRRILHVATALRYDVIFVQRGMLRYASPPVFEALLWLVAGKLLGRIILYHCDDALHTVANPRYYRARFRMAHWVITGSDEVAGFASSVNPRVWRFSAPIEVHRYPVKRHRARGRTIGWVGTLPHDSLPLVSGALAQVCQERDVCVKVVSARPFRLPALGERSVWEPWSSDRRFCVFGDLDIGIMPLADEPYQRGKEAFKLKEYMAAGLPVVCSPVGHNRQVVEPGVVGYFARSEREWVQHLERLIDDPELRARLGRAGRHIAETTFDSPQHMRRFGEFLRAVHRGGDPEATPPPRPSPPEPEGERA
jgi:glycosyltransferase involved in cell wall biosynthesis